MRSSASGLVLLALTGALSVTACKAKPAGPEIASAPAAESALAKSAPAADAAASRAKSAAAESPATPMLAYAYNYVIEAPSDGISSVSRRQEQACTAAGAAVCQVIGSDISARDGETSGQLKLRAIPSWIAGFRGRLDSEIQTAGGRVVSQTVETEDLTRSIVDTGAALRAKTLLRERMEKLLAERPGKLADLVELEKNVAEVQGEIDATQSELTVMQARVQMSDLTLMYRTKDAAFGPRVTGPLGHAFGGFFAHAISVTAALVTLVSYLLPAALAGGLALVVFVWTRRRWPRRPPPPAPKA